MPMLYFRRDVDAVARLKLNSFLALFLIISTSCNTYKDLSAATLCVVDMPIVTATRLKCYIKYSDLTC